MTLSDTLAVLDALAPAEPCLAVAGHFPALVEHEPKSLGIAIEYRKPAA